jgi:hypothetical protein
MIALPSGRILTVAAVTMLGMTLSSGALSRARLYGSNETRTLDCAGGPARIAGANNKVTLTNGCTHLTVLGSGNMVTAELAASASIWFAGSRNEVTWTTADGKEPHVRHLGQRNTLKKGE